MLIDHPLVHESWNLRLLIGAEASEWFDEEGDARADTSAPDDEPLEMQHLRLLEHLYKGTGLGGAGGGAGTGEVGAGAQFPRLGPPLLLTLAAERQERRKLEARVESLEDALEAVLRVGVGRPSGYDGSVEGEGGALSPGQLGEAGAAQRQDVPSDGELPREEDPVDDRGRGAPSRAAAHHGAAGFFRSVDKA